MILLLTTLFLFARRAVSAIDLVSRIFIFTISVFLAQSIFVTVNLVLKVSAFEILAAEVLKDFYKELNYSKDDSTQ